MIVDICQQALRGLASAHERGVIHRDISADNFVVSFDGVVKVVDFGIVRDVLAVALHSQPERRFADARAFQLALEPVRHALPAAELSSWLRENFAERWTRERELSELSDPMPSEVQALLTRESPAAPAGDSKATQLMGPRATPPVESRKRDSFSPPVETRQCVKDLSQRTRKAPGSGGQGTSLLLTFGWKALVSSMFSIPGVS